MGRSILDATATIREALAYAETHNKKLCILSLDFKDAFDISHTYLYEILKGHGFKEGFIDQIRTIYAGAMASVQINGHLSSTFPIQSGIRQGCLLSVILYAIVLNPLLYKIDNALKGVKVGPRTTKTTIVAYADDINILIGYKKRLYKVMTILAGMTDKLDMRIQTRWPTHDWKTIWHNLHTSPVNDTMKGEWYKIIHDLTPTKARLHKIHLSNTDKRKVCAMTDTLIHRITESGEGDVTWEWARRKMAMIIRIDLKYIPKEWVVRPQFKLWPPQTHRAILWLVVHVVVFRIQCKRELTHNDYGFSATQ
jgi:hypothetical protein